MSAYNQISKLSEPANNQGFGKDPVSLELNSSKINKSSQLSPKSDSPGFRSNAAALIHNSVKNANFETLSKFHESVKLGSI